MNFPYDTRLPPDLRALKVEIEAHARQFGLDFYETIFEVVDADDLNEIASYGGFPTRYPHWSFGMAYEELKKGYDYGLSKIYEMVINNDPCYAYLMRCNHVVDQKLVMAHVYGHCLAPETRIEMRGGVKRIPDVTVGDAVLTHTGHFRPVTACARRWHEGRIFKLRVGGSNEVVRMTGEHPVLVLRASRCTLSGRDTVSCRPNCQIQHKCSAPRPYEGYEPEWVPAENVRPGDFVAFPRRRPLTEMAAPAVEISFDKVLHRQRLIGSRTVPVDRDLAKLIGYYIAEGNAQPRGLVGFGFHRDEEEYQNEVARLAHRVFGVNIGTDRSRTALATTVRFNSQEIARWLRREVGRRATEKRVPDFLFEQEDTELLLACLQGIYNGDGTYAYSSGRRAGTLSVTTISECLAYQIRHMALRLSINTAIYRRQRPNRQPSFDVIWSGESAHTLSRLLLGSDVIAGNRSFARSWTDLEYMYQPVREIETEAYSGYVYNFSVEHDESYTLAAGFAVHNCDFFKNNAYFAHTSRKMMDEMANHGVRVRRYVEKYGEDNVESFLDRCMSIDDLIDVHSTFIRRREESSRYDFKEHEEESLRLTRFKSKDYMEGYINPPEALKAEEEERKKQIEATQRAFPERPEKDVLLFLIEYAPLKPWQRDVLSIIRDEAYYFAPQGQTKIMNEGWACLSPQSLIFTCNGLVTMGELARRRLPTRVHDGIGEQSVYDWVEFKDRETVMLRTRRGLEIEGSITHRLLLPDQTWRRLDQFQLGDRVHINPGPKLWANRKVPITWRPQQRLTLHEIATNCGIDVETVIRYRAGCKSRRESPALVAAVAEYKSQLSSLGRMQNRRRPISVPKVVDDRLASFLGYLIGDGHISVVKNVIGLTSGDEEQADHFLELTEDLFGIEPRKKWDNGRWRILFSSHHVRDFLVHLGLKTGRCAREKTVPDCILRSPKEVVVAFLRALYDCDGYAGKAGVILSTSSTTMSMVVQLLLLNFGILSTRRLLKDDCWHVHTLGRSAEVFLHEIGFGLTRKQEKLRQYVESHHWFKDEHWDDEVVSIERGRGDVYDISVEHTHRYAAQGFINHNSYWHSTIMTERALESWECVDYADHHSGTMATSRGRINPYKLGIELLRDIEQRWNTGRFGKEFNECDDLERRRTWDRKLGLGRQKIFEIRKIHNDITFIDTFLTPEFCARHQMFSYAYAEQGGNYVIESREFQKIKQRLLFGLTNFGKPWIYVVDGNYRNRGELLLRHEYNGIDLRLDRAADTLVNVQAIWSRPVHLQTVVDNQPTLMSYDGSSHSLKNLGDSDDPRKHTAEKHR